MEKASKNLIAAIKKQKHEDKTLLFLDNIKIIRDALANKSIEPKLLLTSLGEEEFKKLEIDTASVISADQGEWRNPAKRTKCDGDAPISIRLRLDTIDKNIEKKSCPVYRVDQSTIEMLADTKTPQKVLCIASVNQAVVEMPTTNFLVLDGLQDPGNVGTLIRTAKACGFEYVFLIDSVRKTNSKLVRSSVGAVFNNKVFEVTRKEFCKFAKENKLQLLCCDMNGENIFDFAEKLNYGASHLDLSTSLHSARDDKRWLGVVVGNEGQGVSDEVSALCYKTIKIPMKAGIESLNAAVSGSIIMYEIQKGSF